MGTNSPSASMKKPPGKISTILCQEWEESERGWGVRPDGCSLHLNQEARDKFVKEYWDRQPPGPAPDEYSRPSGDPYLVNVTPKVFQNVIAKSGKHGFWMLQHEMREAEKTGDLARAVP